MIKRFYKQLRGSALKYGLLFLLIFFSSMAMMGILSSVDSANNTVDGFLKSTNVEDGYFQTALPLSTLAQKKIEEYVDSIEPILSVDLALEDSVELRVFAERKKINKVQIVEGESLENDHEILLNQDFAAAHGYAIGDTIELDAVNYIVKGYAVSPDYIAVLKNVSDTLSNHEKFGVGYIKQADFTELVKRNKNNILYQYAYIKENVDTDAIKAAVEEDNKVLSLIAAKDNPRIVNYISDMDMAKQVTVVMCICLIVILVFILAIFIKNTIEREARAIGTLLSLGISKQVLVVYYILLPVMMTAVASGCGTVAGYFIGDAFLASIVAYYNFPIITKSIRMYHIGLSVLFPMIFVILIGIISLVKKLSLTPLKLLREEFKNDRNITVKLPDINFKARFALKELILNLRMYAVLLLGEFLVLFLLLFGQLMQSSMQNYIGQTKQETKFNYMYTLTDYQKVDKSLFENQAEKANLKTLSLYFNAAAKDMNVVMMGIENNNKYFDFRIADNDEGVYISSAVQDKFSLNIGDEIELRDSVENKSYRVKIAGIKEYSNGLFIFINLKQMNKIFDYDEEYYNTILSDDELKIDSDIVYAKTSSKSIINDVESLINRMEPMYQMLIGISVVVFIAVIFLILKIIIGNNGFSITMLSVLGYQKKEISRIYMMPVFWTLIFGLAVGIPLAQILFTTIWPSLILTMQTYINVYASVVEYSIVIGIAALCSVSGTFMFRRLLRSVSFSDVLKDRG